MKKKTIIALSISLMLLVASCSHYTCPTYDNNSGEQKYSGKNRSSDKGLFPKNMQ